MFYFIHYLLLVDACVGLNWLLVSFLSHVNKNTIHSFIQSCGNTVKNYKISNEEVLAEVTGNIIGQDMFCGITNYFVTL